MYNKIIRLSLPLILVNISVPLSGLISTMLMGHLESVKFLTATVIGISILNFITYISAFLRMSTTGVISQYRSHNDWESILIWIIRSIIFCFVIASIILLFNRSIFELITSIFNVSSNVSPILYSYYRVVIFSIFFIFINHIYCGYFIALQKTIFVLLMAVLSNSLNILLGIVLVLYFHLDIIGIAVSFLVGQVAITIVFSFFVISTMKYYLKDSRKFFFSINNLTNIREYYLFFCVNRDLLIRSILLLISLNSFYLFSSHLGNNVVAANGLLLEFSYLLTMVLDSIANITESLIGNNISNYDSVKILRILNTTKNLTIIITIFMTLVYSVTYPYILQILTSLEVVQKTANNYVIYSILFPLFAAYSFWIDGVYIGLLKTQIMRNSMFIASLCYFVLVLLLWRFGNSGLWISFLLFFILRSLTLYFPIRLFLKTGILVKTRAS